jgi:predicted CoA-substrate-specific enzyme activase
VSEIVLGIDVGSTTVKLVILRPDGGLLAHHYSRANGQPRETLLRASRLLDEEFAGARIVAAGLTGSGGAAVANLVGGLHTNELVSQTRALGAFHKEARTVIEIGGQDSKFLSVEWDEASGQMRLLDFAMNTLCAAGTGSFLDQQAERLGIRIDQEFAALALASRHPARIAGRCTVFAKSDMIHLQQEGRGLSDILAGLCQALARNFTGVIGKGKRFTAPVVFQGGVARNAAVGRAFEEVLGLRPGDLIVPRHCDLMGAIGAAYVALDGRREGRAHAFRGFAPLEAAILEGGAAERRLPPLGPPPPRAARLQALPASGGAGSPAYLGVDVGSISTNVVLLDEHGRVLARRYLPTAGRPLDVVEQALAQIGNEVGARLVVRGAGATGSGRHLVAQLVGADVVRNEITAQARAAVAIDPEVDTVIEIGGQDSKFIRIDRGVVVDFSMNGACAAGTGSFLEEQAERLAIRIEEEFAARAHRASAPACLGERCTVFMESDLVHHQQRGVSLDDLTAGLAYAIVHNYLNRVVDARPVGHRVLFLGGVAHNTAVAAAFEAVLGRPVRVPPHHDVTGAIGAALLAREEMRAQPARRTRFRGFARAGRAFQTRSLVCRACPNLCEVKQLVVNGEAPCFYGARCDRFERASDHAAPGEGRTSGMEDLFAARLRLLLGDYEEPGPRVAGRLRVGIPRALTFHDLFPFWHAFFRYLDADVVLSEPTNPRIVREAARSAAETCFPVKLAFGHVLDLLEKDVNCIFMPAVLDREDPSPGQPHSHLCPLVPASPHMVKAHVDPEARGVKVVSIPLHLRERRSRRRELAAVAAALHLPIERVAVAAARGDDALRAFAREARRLGREALDALPPGRPAVVVVGRPYNTCDPGACLDLPRALRKLGAEAIPIDCLAVRDVDLTDRHPDMYWRSGQDILGAARLVAADARLQAIYLTSFQCGPDSFLLSYFRRLMGGKPFLELEVDDHTAEAGLLTRCEAFLDSLRVRREEAA